MVKHWLANLTASRKSFFSRPGSLAGVVNDPCRTNPHKTNEDAFTFTVSHSRGQSPKAVARATKHKRRTNDMQMNTADPMYHKGIDEKHNGLCSFCFCCVRTSVLPLRIVHVCTYFNMATSADIACIALGYKAGWTTGMGLPISSGFNKLWVSTSRIDRLNVGKMEGCGRSSSGE